MHGNIKINMEVMDEYGRLEALMMGLRNVGYSSGASWKVEARRVILKKHPIWPC
jgi:hypothetical protein